MSTRFSRRALFGALPAAAVAATTVNTMNHAMSQDRELIDLTDQFVGVERRRRSLFPNFTNFIEDDGERDLALEPLDAQQKVLQERICQLPVRTKEGAAALARAAILWWPHLLEEITDTGGLDGRLLLALLQGLAPEAVFEAKQMQSQGNTPTAQDAAWAQKVPS